MDKTEPKRTTGLQRLWFILKLLEIRLRFVLVLLITALVVGYWDTIQNYWARWTRSAPENQAAAQKQSETEFFCPMHPFVVRETPGKCPICGMDLIQRKKGAQEPLPEGAIARVQVSPDRVMQAGVKVEPVEARELSREITAYGTIEVDETRWARVTARFPGRVEEVFVEAPGLRVSKGQALAKIYSPKYLAATLEYVQAVQAKHRAEKDSSLSQEQKIYETELADLTRKPLERQGFTKEQLDEIERTEKASDRITLASPAAGVVIEKNVVPGDNVEEGTVLYTVADLSSVWVLAQIPESDIGGIAVGLTADISTVSFPGETFSGKVDLMFPSIGSENRSVKVRMTLPNEDLKLKPGMYVAVTINVPVTDAQKGTKVLALPESAVIDTGRRKIVYEQSSEGVFDAHEVTLGARAGNYYPVIKGLNVGDKVVSRGSFLIDAEARLNPSAQMQKSDESTQATDSKKNEPEYSPDRCVVSGEKLGSMGEPVTVEYRGRSIKLCCKGCIKDFEKDPEKYLRKIDRSK